MFIVINTEGIYCILSALMMCHFVFYPGNLPFVIAPFYPYLPAVVLDVTRPKKPLRLSLDEQY